MTKTPMDLLTEEILALGYPISIHSLRDGRWQASAIINDGGAAVEIADSIFGALHLLFINLHKRPRQKALEANMTAEDLGF